MEGIGADGGADTLLLQDHVVKAAADRQGGIDHLAVGISRIGKFFQGVCAFGDGGDPHIISAGPGHGLKISGGHVVIEGVAVADKQNVVSAVLGKHIIISCRGGSGFCRGGAASGQQQSGQKNAKNAL